MPRSYRHRPQRKRVFVACEGASEYGYAAHIGFLAEEEDLAVHLDICNCHGGDPLAIVEKAVKQLLLRKRQSGAYAVNAIFLDADRRKESPNRTDRAKVLLRRHGFHVIWSKPTFESLLLKHMPGYERSEPTASNLAFQQLKNCWPEYCKGLTSMQLRYKLDRASVVRAAAVVPELQAFLDSLGFSS